MLINELKFLINLFDYYIELESYIVYILQALIWDYDINRGWLKLVFFYLK